MGVLGWSPDQFWASTHRELMAALDGFCEKNGTRERKEQPKLPVTRSRLNELMEMYPDGS